MPQQNPYNIGGTITTKASTKLDWPVWIVNRTTAEVKRVLLDTNGAYQTNLANWDNEYTNGDVIEIILSGRERGFTTHTVDTATQGSSAVNISTTYLETNPSGGQF